MTTCEANGITLQPNKLNMNVNTGANKNIYMLTELGIIVSFANNFKPSANACNKPYKPTTWGLYVAACS